MMKINISFLSCILCLCNAYAQTGSPQFVYETKWQPGREVRIEIQQVTAGTTRFIGNTDNIAQQINLEADSFRSNLRSNYRWSVMPTGLSSTGRPTFNFLGNRDSLLYYRNGVLFPLPATELVPIQFSAVANDLYGGVQIEKFTPMPDVPFQTLMNSRITAQQELNVVNMLFPGPFHVNREDPWDVIDIELSRTLASDSTQKHVIQYRVVQIVNDIAEIAIDILIMQFQEPDNMTGYISNTKGSGILRYDMKAAFPISLSYTTHATSSAVMGENLSMEDTWTSTTHVAIRR
jgi:hypothetical protein